MHVEVRPSQFSLRPQDVAERLRGFKNRTGINSGVNVNKTDADDPHLANLPQRSTYPNRDMITGSGRGPTTGEEGVTML